MLVTKTRICLLICLFISQLAQASVDYDVLDLPAVESKMATKSLIYNVKTFGDRTFATGHKGHILYSDDNGDTWTQAQVPVRLGILDIYFVNADKGWAVGHGGVILHSADGGETWEKQYDGYRFGEEGLKYYQQRAEEDPESELMETLVYEMEYAVSQGADKPFFSVYFDSETVGYAFGAYGIIVKTEDGGKTWVHWMHTVENDSYYHLFDYTMMENGRFLLNGEAGLIFDASVEDDYTTLLPNSPYEGSFFTSTTASDGSLIVAGLRGFTFVSQDNGQNWQESKKPQTGSVVDSITLADGRVIAVAMTGEVLVSDDNGNSFNKAAIPYVGPIFAVGAGGDGHLLLAGPRGIIKVAFAD
ncbi:MAG: YCF48-related protein [Candidatus Pelagadaptatus aseana]|uniref:WD40/YVTN/BNR-like repeat-containing protein n=1 Tax=Candidatus Pelagadaptatus aseana TaxID=3120508 RepID=UPI0039B2DF05